MKKMLFIFFIALLTVPVFSQVSVRAGMAINLASTPSLNDYINQNFAGPDQLTNFATAISFSGEADYSISSTYEVGVEMAYFFNSHTFNFNLGQYELSYGILMPSIVNYYIISGDGYNFKLGGGAGIRFVSADEHLPGAASTNNYKSVGFGVLLKGEGNTALSDNLFANIGGIIRYDINGEPESNGNPIKNNVTGENVNLNSLSLGLRLGLTYYF